MGAIKIPKVPCIIALLSMYMLDLDNALYRLAVVRTSVISFEIWASYTLKQ